MSDRQSHAETIFHVPGLGSSLSSQHKSWSQRWTQLWQPARRRAHCIPLKKKETLSFKKCHPEQHLSMRDKASWRCHHLLVLRGDTVQWFSKSLSRWREWAKGAVPGYAKATWCTQHTARQLASWGRLIKWPGWSDKKEDILGTSKRQMGRRTTQGHAVMPQWQDDSWLLLEDQYALNTSPTPFCSQEAAS